MTANAFVPIDAPPTRLTRRAVFVVWRDITREQIVAAFMLGCGYFLFEQVLFLQYMLQQPGFAYRPLLLTVNFVQDQFAAFALLACVVVADRISGQTTQRAAYVVAVAISACVVGPSEMLPRTTALLYGPGSTGLPHDGFARLYFEVAWQGFIQWLLLGGSATLVYTDRRRAKAARARMHAAELERAHAAKRTLESRLQAMQARVEPQFLFNTLAQVRDLYRADATRGEQMLDELIAYLRAAMPRMRDTSSTVGQEFDLVRAYLGIVRLRVGERLAFEIETPENAPNARMPPMMLLPLVDHAIAHGFTQAQATGSIRIRPVDADATIQVVITHSGGGFLPESEGADIAGIRDRLAGLYQGRASLVLEERVGGTTEAILAFPAEPVT